MTDPVLGSFDARPLEPEASTASFPRLARVRAVHSFRRRRRFVIVVLLGTTVTAISGVGFTTVREMPPREVSPDRPEPRPVEAAAPVVARETAVAPPLVELAPATVSPVPGTDDPAPRRRNTSAERPASKRTAAGLQRRRDTARKMPKRQTRDSTPRAEATATDANPAAVIEWLLERSRPGTP